MIVLIRPTDMYAVEDHHSIYIRELEEEKLGVLELQRTLYARRNALRSANHQRA